MLVFFTNLSLLKFQVRYLALILLFSELDMKMDGSVLGEKSFFRILGLTFSFKLNWGLHLGTPYRGQPEAHYSKFSFKQYFPFQHEHLILDLTKIHEKNFFSLMTKVWPLIFIIVVTALNFEL